MSGDTVTSERSGDSSDMYSCASTVERDVVERQPETTEGPEINEVRSE